jgi:hypothetical protein
MNIPTPGEVWSHISYTHVNREKRARDQAFCRDFWVYVLVIILIMLSCAFVRVSDETATSPGELRDAARYLFPYLNTSSPARKTSGIHVKGREDIQSFGFDLGGSTCACLLQWDARQYWQRVFYGVKYAAFHCTTAFFGVLCLHRLQWMLLWKVLNEVLEEIGLPIVGRFAWTGPVLKTESRYDTLINDTLLAGVLFGVLGLHAVTVLSFFDHVPHPVHVDKKYMSQLLLLLLQYNMFNVANGSNVWFAGKLWTFGGVECEAGKLAACLLQVTLIWLLFYMKKWSFEQAFVITGSTSLLWAPFVFHRVGDVDEQIQAILSFSLTGLSLCCYQVLTSKHPLILMLSCPWYILALGLWWAFPELLDPPKDRFYFNNKWCGLSDASSNSCLAIR